MNCPVCRTPGAYVGFSAVECRNPDCNHYRPFVPETVITAEQTQRIKIYKYIPVNSNFSPMTFVKGGKFYRAAQYDYNMGRLPWSYNKGIIDTLIDTYEKGGTVNVLTGFFAKLEFDLNPDPGSLKGGDNSLISTYFTVKGYTNYSIGFHQCNGFYYITDHGNSKITIMSKGNDKTPFFKELNIFHNDSNFEGKIYSESFEHE